MRLLPEAVAAFQRQLATARPHDGAAGAPKVVRRHLTIEQLAARSYKDRLRQDVILRENSTAWAGVAIDTDYAASLRDGMAGRLTDSSLDELVGNRIEGFKARGETLVTTGSPEWRRLAVAICAAEYEALKRVFERDEGNFDGQPQHPVLKSLDGPEPVAPADVMELWDQYVAKRQKEGSMLDGGRRQVLAVKSLAGFTKKTNANDLTKKDISDWQDYLLTKISVRTIAKVYLPTIRSLFSWAVKRELMAIKQFAALATRIAEAATQLATKDLADGLHAQAKVVEAALGVDFKLPPRDFFDRISRDERGEAAGGWGGFS